LDPHDVTAYIQGGLEPAARTRVEAHLSDCDECATEVAEVSRLWRPASPRVRWLGPATAAAAAAAIIAVALIGPRARQEAREAVPPVRGDTAAAVEVLAPRDGAAPTATPVFVWRPVPGAAAYRVSVSLADGDSVWAFTTRDTSARPPDSLLARDVEVYYWYVDALLSDGRSVAGTAHQFRLGP
jgi:anti-sigma factor RsiW